MDSIAVESLPYRRDSATVFAPIAAEPWAVFLDSTADVGGSGRYDIIAAAPRVRLQTFGTHTRIAGGPCSTTSTDDPLILLREAIGPAELRAGFPMVEVSDDRPPFCGGAIGWFGYDLARRFDTLGLGLPRGLHSPLPTAQPQLAVGIYDWALVSDHQAGRTWLVGRRTGSAAVRARLRALALAAPAAEPGASGFAVTGHLTSNLDQAAYRARFAQVQAHIRAGDCYQVNLARRFSAPASGDPWVAYRYLRRINPAPFAAYLHTPALTLLSASPERFLAVRGDLIETQPIKGTSRRDPDPERDRALAAALLASPKDRAENLMIVDLLRNDLGRCAALGSVRVPRLFALESFAGVHHLVSTVTARLAADRDALDLLRACLPGGSVTGAPKRKTMQIIDALEGEARGPYCGAIGYLGFDGTMDSSITIRTLAFTPGPGDRGAGGELRFWAGGGLVADSDCDAEWAEIGIKARAMFDLVARFRSAGEAD